MIGYYDENDDKSPAVTNSIRGAWNEYVDWLDQKGFKGNTQLDTEGLGNKLLLQYIRENPLTPLRPEHVKPIQQDFANYRNYALDQVKQGKAVLSEGVTPDNFMVELSKLDNYPGSMTTKHKFPREYLNYLDEQGKTIKTEDKGFATTQ